MKWIDPVLKKNQLTTGWDKSLRFFGVNSFVGSNQRSSVADPLDGYGGRQLFGHVLLRNSRHDAVRRLPLGLKSRTCEQKDSLI